MFVIVCLDKRGFISEVFGPFDNFTKAHDERRKLQKDYPDFEWSVKCVCTLLPE